MEPRAMTELNLDPIGAVVKDFAPIWGPITGGLFGYFIARIQRQDKAAADAKVQAATDKKDMLANEVAISEATNRRFQTLMDGYEQRIGDLTSEVHALREEVKSLRKALDARSRHCVGCPKFQQMQLDGD
jgi:chromosome segregation ATPase